MKILTHFRLVALGLVLTVLQFDAIAREPVLIHSHNDYRQPVPFYQAYSQQVYAIEADLYVDEINNRLLVAHDQQEVATAPTFEELYLNPLVFLFGQNGGRPWHDSEKILTLMIDFKTPLHPTMEVLIGKVGQFPEVFDPATNPFAVRIVISGSRPDPVNFSQYPSYISFDGFIDLDHTPDQLERIAFFSEPFYEYSKWKGVGELSTEDRKILEGLIFKAHAQGKPIRFWGSPDTQLAWQVFHELGIDIINTDQPEACTLYFKAGGD